MTNNKSVIALVKIWHGPEEDAIPPMGLLFIGNELKKAGYTVKVFHWTKVEALSRINEIVEIAPIIVGFSLITGDPLDIVSSFCKELKRKLPDTPIVFGGIHPSFEPEQCLAEEFVDYVIQLEGEEPIVELVDALRGNKPVNNIANLGYKSDGKVVVNDSRSLEKNIDKFEMDWSLVDIERYIRPYMSMDRVLMGYVVSRGCPHPCAFCYNIVFNQKKWRRRGAEKAIYEINTLAKEHNLDALLFHDDNFTVNKKWAFEILSGINVRGVHLETRIDYVDDKFLKQLEEHNVASIFFGVESGSNRLLELIKKEFTYEDIVSALVKTKKCSYGLKLSFIVGVPTETLSEYRQTLDLAIWALENLPDVGFTFGFYSPYPGTPLFELCVERGFKRPERFEDWTMLDRWGTREMPLPWIEGSYITSTEVARIRYIAGIMVKFYKNKSFLNNIKYAIYKFRFLNSGTTMIRAWSYMFEKTLDILRFFRINKLVRALKGIARGDRAATERVKMTE